jgi:hypothetical protein
VKLFDWIFGASNSAGKVIDGAIAGIDKIVYTEEEKADARSKLLEQWIKLQETLGEETTVRGVTRRILAIMFCGAYILLSVSSAFIWPFWQEYANFLWEVANGQYGWITTAVAVFYFGPYAFEKMLSAKK